MNQIIAIPDTTVVVHTYNQENYISECLDGILLQSCNSRIRVLIIDDASTDKTVEICKDYQSKSPLFIEIVALEKNQLSLGLFVGFEAYSKIRTKYIAWCDGDDYWTDKFKIEKEISILEKNPEISIVHSNYLVLRSDEKGSIPESRANFEIERAKKFNQGKNLVSGNLIKQSTALILKDKIDFNFVGSASGIYACDWLICISASQKHNIHFISDITAVVRVTNRGIWSGATKLANENQKTLIRWYCAARLPESELRELFRKKVLLDWVRNKVAISDAYKVIRPAVMILRKFKYVFQSIR